MPKDMETVEKKKEDLAHDMIVHVDTEVNAYDFAFALDFTEIINDQRTKLYKR